MRYFRLIVNLAAPIGMALLIYWSWDSIVDSLKYVFGGIIELEDGRQEKASGLPLWGLLLIIGQIPFQLLTIAITANFYYSYFRQAGILARAKIKDFYQVVLELNFVNSVFPSGGVSSFSYLGLRLRPLGIKASATMVVQSLRIVLSLISYLPILALGVLALTIDEKIGNWLLLIAVGSFFSIVFICLAGWYLISDAQRIKHLIRFLPQIAKWLSRRFFWLRPTKVQQTIDKIDRAFLEIRNDYIKIKKNPRQIWSGTRFMFLYNLVDVLTLYMICWVFYSAFGQPVINFGVVVLAYMFANLAGMIFIFPGGIGAYEFVLILVAKFSQASSPNNNEALVLVAPSHEPMIVAALTFRLLKLLISVPVGLFYYQAAIKKKLKVPSLAETKED